MAEHRIRTYPTRRLVTELGLIRLISLVPGITMLLTPARRPYRKAACYKPARSAPDRYLRPTPLS
jgi:hypothetical protein